MRTRTCPACGRSLHPLGYAPHCMAHWRRGELRRRLVWENGREMTPDESRYGPAGCRITRWAFRLPEEKVHDGQE